MQVRDVFAGYSRDASLRVNSRFHGACIYRMQPMPELRRLAMHFWHVSCLTIYVIGQ